LGEREPNDVAKVQHLTDLSSGINLHLKVFILIQKPTHPQ